MDEKKIAITAKRMTQARAVLIKENPFLGALSLRLQLACAPCGTACTDGERLIMDPDFAEQLTSERELQFVILHELLHCVLEHCIRVGTKDNFYYNVACDMVVNSVIFEMWGLETFFVAGKEPMHIAPNGHEGREYSAEEVYEMLLNDEGIMNQENDTTEPAIDRHDTWDKIKDKNRIRNVWNRAIKNAVEISQGLDSSDMPQSVRNVLDQWKTRSKVDWKQQLHDFLQQDTYDYNFLPPDRRFAEDSFYLPAYNLDEEAATANDIWICIDTSASMNDTQLHQALVEVQDAMRQVNLTGYISFFDHLITNPIPFTTQEELKAIVPCGGGGTDCHLIFQYLKEEIAPEFPRAILIFTDGEIVSWPKEQDALEVPVLWIIIGKRKVIVPWGKTVYIAG